MAQAPAREARRGLELEQVPGGECAPHGREHVRFDAVGNDGTVAIMGRGGITMVMHEGGRGGRDPWAVRQIGWQASGWWWTGRQGPLGGRQTPVNTHRPISPALVMPGSSFACRFLSSEAKRTTQRFWLAMSTAWPSKYGEIMVYGRNDEHGEEERERSVGRG